MERLGLVGGLGPESTIDYYRRIVAAWRATSPRSAPALVIDSLDVDIGLSLVEHDRHRLIEYLLDSLGRLAGAGATFGAIAANTAHVVFEQLAARSPLPLISIVDACAAEASRRHLRRLILLGTRFTMSGGFYERVFAPQGIEVITPDSADQSWLHERYVGELLNGVFLPETRHALITRVERLRDRAGADGVILGGTELPLLLGDGEVAGLPTLDTTAIHVDAIVRRLRTS